MKKSIWLIIAVCLLLLSGCGLSKEIETYRYSNPNAINEVKITKTVYLDDKIIIKIVGLGDDEYNLVCFDKDFNCLEGDFTYEYKRGMLVIHGDTAPKISGIYLDGAYRRFHIRYLDSSEYAIQYYTEATEIGFMLTSESDKSYDTPEETAAKQEAGEKYERQQKENFALFEGTWECTTDPSMYLRFYDGNQLEWQLPDGEGGYYIRHINVDEININIRYDRPELEILDGIDWGCRYAFYLSEDYSQIIDDKLDSEDIYVLKE